MAFWSGEKLLQRLPNLVTPFDVDNIDCASYRLSVGDQAFVTSDELSSTRPEPNLVTVFGPAPKNMLRIAPGQFAFLLTDQEIEVPNDAIAFISMRAKYKLKGLINVSGFHVDPGWKGKLLYSVYNAGPQSIIIEKGEELFLVVYSDLDQTTEYLYNGKAKGQNGIRSDLLENISSQVFSPQLLKKNLDEVSEKFSDIRMNTKISILVAGALATILAIIIAGVALLPSWTGVVIARTLDSAGYEVRQKPTTNP